MDHPEEAIDKIKNERLDLPDTDISNNDARKKVDQDLGRISSHPDFLSVAQFIGSFGSLLGIPPISIDTLEDGLESNRLNSHQDAYYDACGTAVEHLLISLLKRCGILSNVEKLVDTLREYFEIRDDSYCPLIDCATFCGLQKTTRLNILKIVCMNQFDENAKFKTEFNSQYSPDDLRWSPLGRDIESCQYWFISDSEKNHRLYRWKYPYSADQWSLLSSTYNELVLVKDRLKPLEEETEIKESKLWEIFQEQSPSSAIQIEEKMVKKPRKKKKEMVEAGEEHVMDEDVEFRVKTSAFRMRKSLRNVDRKVYTEPNEENDTSEEEEEQKQLDDKYKRAITIAKSRKRSKKFLSISDVRRPVSSEAHQDMVSMARLKEQMRSRYASQTTSKPNQDGKFNETLIKKETSQDAAQETIINVKVESVATPKKDADRSVKSENMPGEEVATSTTKVLSNDPFAFSDSNDTSSRQSSDSNASMGFSKQKCNNGDRGNGDGSQTKSGLKRESSGPEITQRNWKPVTAEQHKSVPQFRSVADAAFLQSLKDMPSLSNIKKPKEAEDKCWTCDGEEDVDKMLFCDGCDLATYHMACLKPPIEDVPDDDWLCPVCEQVLLFLNIREKLSKLKFHPQTPSNRGRARKSCANPRSNSSPVKTFRPISRQQHLIHRTQNSVHRPQLPANHTQNSGQTFSRPLSQPGVRLITPTRLATGVRYIARKPRPKIGQIDRLAETAKLVFDPNTDDTMHMSPLARETRLSRYRKEDASSDDTDSEIVHPTDESSSSDTAEQPQFSYRPNKPLYGQQPPGVNQALHQKKVRLSPDYFLNKPTKPVESRETKIMGYNPLNFLRQPGVNTPLKVPQQSHTAISEKGSSLHLPAEQRKHIVRKRESRDTATAIMEGRSLENGDDVEDSRSGNVVTPTAELSESQRQALAAWENMERDRKRDSFDFDE